MIEADRADHSRAKLDHDLIVPITTHNTSTTLELLGTLNLIQLAFRES